MLKRERIERQCDICGKRPWCAISILTGLRRCFRCWATYWERKALVNG
jgi:hypothetical protein